MRDNIFGLRIDSTVFVSCNVLLSLYFITCGYLIIVYASGLQNIQEDFFTIIYKNLLEQFFD